MKETIQGSKSRPTKDIEIAKKPAHKNRIQVLGATRRMLAGSVGFHQEWIGFYV
ncbi:MAG TPA: hypothetical protein VMU69_10455 [Bradyrhizobium sp.]|nr:hypothetical protein [Bradyrhizobium sp.]